MLQTLPVKETTTTKKLLGKTAVITGAASGIGRAAAIKLASEGANIALVDLKENQADQVVSELQTHQVQAKVYDTDVSDPMRVERAINEAAGDFGQLDILFANAGINGKVTPIEDMTPEDWDHTLSTNLKSTFLTVKYAISHMKQAGGSIIITSSINGNRKFSNFGMSAYSTSKAGQSAFGKMAALELARYRIRVNVICPGAIQTNISQSTQKTPELQKIEIPVQYPQGSQPLEHGPGQPEQVAELVKFLASAESDHITGTTIYIDGAESLL